MDLCLFRVYQDDKPARIDHFLKIASVDTREGDLVFVSGNPGRTQRIFTSAALAYQRDAAVPFALNMLRRREILLQQYGLDGAEQQRRAREDVFGPLTPGGLR